MEGNPLVSDPGPEFDPEAGAEQPENVHRLEVLDVHWQPDRISHILRAQGLVTHEAIGVGQEDWLWRDGELQAISEPAANALNKFPVTHAAAGVSDELTVGAVMLNYAMRSIRERSKVLRAQKQAAGQADRPPAPQPITVVNAAGDPVGWRVPGEPDGMMQ